MLTRAPARSRNPIVKGGPLDNSASGSRVKRCYLCSRAEVATKETIRNGLLLLRVRYGLPYVELPESSPSSLGRFLCFLLGQGKERTSVPFPRRQRPGENGLFRLQRLCRKERWELAHGVSSIKRNLPAGCHLHTPSSRSAWEANATSIPPPSPPEYLEHVRRVSAQVFRPGWDGSYRSFVGSFLPNPTARKPRLSRGDLLWAGRREEFITKTTCETDLTPLMQARYKEVLSAGKKRPLLIFDESVDLLGPLHKLMYSHLKRQEWLLCGPPTDKQVASVCVNAFQTSVDLVAATDGLCHDVAETILDVAFFSSLEIPRSLRALAKASLTPVFWSSRGCLRRVRHGQMMGAYLSFPLLCLQSYCAASWAARFDEGARYLVNGDDCVISASRAVVVGDYPPGFRLNDDKTIRAVNVVEVNSTVFLRRGGKWREVRHLRRGGATASFRGMMHLVAATKFSPCWQDALVRSRIGRRWGFLPSQIGCWTYPSWLRQRVMTRPCVARRGRLHTELPSSDFRQDESGLRRIQGRDPTPLESEALRAFLWEGGRRGRMKRDEYDPSPGYIRRTYRYRARPYTSSVSFVYWRTGRTDGSASARFFLVPDEFEAEEESVGLFLLDRWRLAFDSLAEE